MPSLACPPRSCAALARWIVGKRHHAAHATATVGRSTTDDSERKRFEELSSDWNKEDGPFKALYSMNALRVPWIVNSFLRNKPDAKKPGRLLEVGCGGGILSIALARRGINVVAIDTCEQALQAAKERLACNAIPPAVRQRIQFRCVDVEDLSKEEEAGSYDCVVSSEVVEHVSDVSHFAACVSALAAPRAPLLFTTINRTTLSRVAAIWMAEDVLGIVPSGMHEWSKFVQPEELGQWLERGGCETRGVYGMAYDPFSDKWSWTTCTSVNYALEAVKTR